MMPDTLAKQIVLDVLQREPDFSGLADIPALRSKAGERLLCWLDYSGLALNFLRSVECSDEAAHLPKDWRNVLKRRMDRNATRLKDMLGEFRRLNDAFRANGVKYVTMKGFSLLPDFYDDAVLRHQTDFDFLVEPNDVESAAAVLQSLGYSTPRLSRTEESSFTTPLSKVPSHKDDLYAIQQHRQVDLHVSLTEKSEWIQLRVPDDCMSRAVDMNLYGIQFWALALPDRFVCQVLHAFRHCFRSWVRLSWLMEIGRCMEMHAENDNLWSSVIELSGNDVVAKRIFGFVLCLTNQLFKFRISSQLRAWTEQGMTKSIRVWLDHFSEKWALADWPGNLSNLLLAPEFIPDRKLRNEYLASRLFPKKAVAAVESLRGPATKKPLLGNVQQWIYVAQRSRVHLKDLLALPADLLRWKFALR